MMYTHVGTPGYTGIPGGSWLDCTDTSLVRCRICTIGQVLLGGRVEQVLCRRTSRTGSMDRTDSIELVLYVSAKTRETVSTFTAKVSLANRC